MTSIKSSLAYKFIIKILIFNIFISILFTGLQLYSEYQVELSKIDSAIKAIKTRYLESISQNIWNYNYEQVKLQLKGLSDIEYISRAVILDINDKEIISGVVPGKQTKTYVFNLMYQDSPTPLGTLSIDVDLQAVNDKLLHGLIRVLAYQIGFVLFISLFIFYLFYSLVGRHLQTISNYLKKDELDNIDNKLVIDRDEVDDELDVIIQSFNAIRNKVLEKFKNDAEILASQYAEIQESKHQAEQANQAKSLFLSNMSHEMRTPLTAVLGFTEILTREIPKNDKCQEYTSNIITSGQHLLQIINDILDISKIESGNIELEPLPFVFSLIMSDVKKILDYKAQKKKIDFSINYNFPFPTIVSCDPVRLKQIIINLGGNAIKFTAGGHVTIDIGFERETSMIKVLVIDTGIGIPDDKQDHIFDTFSQADLSTTRLYGGSGLGLAISKHLAQALGGDLLLVESTLGKGSTFQLNVKVAIDSNVKWAQSANDLQTVALKNDTEEIPQLTGKVLLAEDWTYNQELIAMYLSRAGLNYHIVENGREAVEYALREDPDVILMDIQMPEMDGVEATQMLRSADFNSPIIALTANVMHEDVNNYLNVGFSSYLSKPFEQHRFYHLLSRYLPKKSTSPKDMIPSKHFLKLLAKYTKNLTNILQQLLELEEKQDFAGLKRVVHNLKGTGTPYGFPIISEISGNIEDALIANDEQQVKSLMPKLYNTINSIINN